MALEDSILPQHRSLSIVPRSGFEMFQNRTKNLRIEFIFPTLTTLGEKWLYIS